MEKMAVCKPSCDEVDGKKYSDCVDEKEAQASLIRNFRSAAVTIKNGPEQEIWRETELRPGLWLSVMDVKPEKAVMLRYEKRNPLISFGFVLAGEMWNRLQSPSMPKMELTNRAGLGGILFLPESEGRVEIPAQKRIQMLHVHVDPKLLYSMLQDELGILPSDFKPVVEGANKGYSCQGEMDPVVQAVAYQIFHAPCHGMPKRLFLEGKALELICLQISWMGSRNGLQRKRPALSPSERDRIHAAKEILVQNMASPPTLSQLSQSLSLSINKLEFGFRELYGTTVFGFLKEYQMQKARLLFEEADMNVSQVAWAVGYVNVSHFSAAFKKRFGIQPKTYLKSARRKRIIA